MSIARLIPWLAGATLVFYPLLVYTGLTRWGAQPIALVLLGVTVARLLVSYQMKLPIGNVLWLVLAALIVAVFTLLTGSVAGLKSYPVLVNLFMLTLFSFSLWRPPSMIERFARLHEPDLPASGVAYTRRVTKVWCAFFAINALVATATLFTSDKVWALYNGFIAYLLMAVLLAVEFLVRKRVRGDQNPIAEQ